MISLATDADTGEETVIWTAYPFADVPRYCTSSKKSFCTFVEVDGERRAKYKRLTYMKISEAAIERLEDEGFRGPVRKRQRRQLEEENRRLRQKIDRLQRENDRLNTYLDGLEGADVIFRTPGVRPDLCQDPQPGGHLCG